MKALLLSDLHGSLSDPVMEAMNFLNEVMDRYPQAISFAPGAPYGGFYEALDPMVYIERYMRHLADEQGLSDAQIRKRLFQYGAARGQINGLIATALSTEWGVPVDPQAIVVTVGCQEAMLLSLRALFAQPGDVLGVVNPSFIGIAGAARLLDVPTLAIADAADGEGAEQGIDWEAVSRRCDVLRAQGQRLRALYVAPDFSNPSGRLMPLAERLALLHFASQHDVLLLEDNAYGFTAAPGSELPTLKSLDRDGRVLYLGTCAKICLPGARVGFVVADQPVDRGPRGRGLLADHITALKSMVTVNTPPLCQALVGGMLLVHGPTLSAIGRDKAALYRRNLTLLLAALEREIDPGLRARGVCWTRPSGGFFIRVQLPVDADEALLALSAQRYGVLWTPMSVFHLDGGGRRELRLSCSYLEPAQIDEGVRRLAAFLRDPAVCAPQRQPEEETA